MGVEYSRNLDDDKRILSSQETLEQIEGLIEYQNLIGYVEGYINGNNFYGDTKEVYSSLDKKIKSYGKERPSLPDLKDISREIIDSFLDSC